MSEKKKKKRKRKRKERKGKEKKGKHSIVVIVSKVAQYIENYLPPLYPREFVDCRLRARTPKSRAAVLPQVI